MAPYKNVLGAAVLKNHWSIAAPVRTCVDKPAKVDVAQMIEDRMVKGLGERLYWLLAWCAWGSPDDYEGG